MFQKNAARECFMNAVCIGHFDPCKFQVKKLLDRGLSAPLGKRENDPVNVFAGNDFFHVAGCPDDPGVDKRLANVLASFIQETCDLDVECGPRDDLADQRYSSRASAKNEHTLEFGQHMPP